MQSIFNIPVSGVESTRVWHIKFPSIVILYVSLTRHIKLFARHKLFGKCYNVTPLTFRATVRDLPTLLHKVSNAQ